MDQIAAPVPAKEGAGGWLSGSLSEGEVGQLRAHVEGMVKAEKYTDPPAVAPALQREAPAPHATKFAAELEQKREDQLKQLRCKLQKCMRDGTFKAVLSSGRRPTKLKAAQRRQKKRQEGGDRAGARAAREQHVRR